MKRKTGGVHAAFAYDQKMSASMTYQEKHAVIAAITCPRCRNYAWELARMSPIRSAAGHWHHPTCTCVTLSVDMSGGGK